MNAIARWLPSIEKRQPFGRGTVAGFGNATALFAVLLCAGCQTPKTMPVDAMAAPAPMTSEVLSAGDVLKVTFPSAPELTQTQKIRMDGKVSLPLIGEVNAAGKRLEDFQKELTRLYAPQLRDKEVVVSIEASLKAVYVSGAVGRAGKVVLDRPMTALEAVMEAGGFSPVANPKKVTLVRQENGQHRTQVLDLSPALRGETTNAFYLKPYDMLIVQERMF